MLVVPWKSLFGWLSVSISPAEIRRVWLDLTRRKTFKLSSTKAQLQEIKYFVMGKGSNSNTKLYQQSQACYMHQHFTHFAPLYHPGIMDFPVCSMEEKYTTTQPLLQVWWPWNLLIFIALTEFFLEGGRMAPSTMQGYQGGDHFVHHMHQQVAKNCILISHLLPVTWEGWPPVREEYARSHVLP